MKNNRQSKETRKSSRVLAVMMALMMIIALILPIGAKASETADGSASGASQAVAEEHTEKEEGKDSSDSDAEKEEEKEEAESVKTEEKEQKSDSSADAVSEDSSDSKTESKDAESKDTDSKKEASGSDQTSGKDASDLNVKEVKDKNDGKSSDSDQKDSQKTDSSKNEKDKADAAPAKDTSSGKSGQAEISEETAEQVTAEQKDDDTTITFRTDEVTVIADKKAFDTEVTMKVKKVTDPEQLLKMVTALQEEGGSYTVKAYNVSFYDKNGKEVEPKIPVQVNVNTKVSAPKKTKVVHVKDDDRTEILDANIDRSGASFELGSFSDIGVATEGKAKVPGNSFDIYLGDELTTEYTVDDLPAGPISEDDLPAVDGYAYENATVGDDQVEEIGTITDEDGNVYVYYTTKDENGTIQAEILGGSRIRINLVKTDADTTYDITVNGTRIKVTAPADAFDPGTEMYIENVTDPDTLLKMLSALKDGEVYSIFAVDISFRHDGTEVEPAVPVTVTMESSEIKNGMQLVHLEDDKIPVKIVADVERGKAVFELDSFSAVGAAAIEQDYVPSESIRFFDLSTNSELAGAPTGNLTPGVPSAIAPEITDYVFVNAKAIDENQSKVVEVTYVGCFISEGTTYTYYRTATDQNDLIVHVEKGERIDFNYQPANNYYTINYSVTGDTGGEGTTVDEVFGTDRTVSSVKNSTAVGYTVTVPRGYTATVKRNGSAVAALGTEPSYSVSSDNKVITKNGELNLSGTYTIPASTNMDQTIEVTLSKRTSYSFDASYFLSTVYTGGSGMGTMGDDAVNTNSNARITGDSTLGRSGANKGKKTFSASDNGASVSWSFETNTTESSTWLMDALEINGTTIEVPYAADTSGNVGVSKTTTLPSGTVVTVSLDSMRRVTVSNQTRYQRTYTISVTNCYEDIVISGGNIYNSNNSTEIIPEVLDHIDYSFYGYTTSDLANAHSGLGWHDWGVGEPIAVGNNASTGSTYNYNMYGFNQTLAQGMRFQVDPGYVNPQIAYVTSTEGELISNIGGLTLGTKKDGYYPINSSAVNGYYSFRVTGMGNNNKLALLRIKADLGFYGVTYNKGFVASVTDGTLPAADYGNYNVETKPQIVLSSLVPTDTTGNNVFQYWTIDGDSSQTHYAPGQVINVVDVCKYAVDDGSGRLVIPLKANWQSKELAEQISYKIEFMVEGEDDPAYSFDMLAPKGSAIYVNKDSERIKDMLEVYRGLLEYDEGNSATYIDSVDQGDEIKLRFKWVRVPVTIEKTVNSVSGDDKSKEFSFTASSSRTYEIYKYDAATGTIDTTQTETKTDGYTFDAFKLKDSETHDLKEKISSVEYDFRKGSALTLNETNSNGFTVSYVVTTYEEDGTTIKEEKNVTAEQLAALKIDEKTKVTVTNSRGSIDVYKTVRAGQGGTIQQSDITTTIYFTLKKQGESGFVKDAGGNIYVQSIAFTNGTSSADHITFAGIPDGTYEVWELKDASGTPLNVGDIFTAGGKSFQLSKVEVTSPTGSNNNVIVDAANDTTAPQVRFTNTYTDVNEKIAFTAKKEWKDPRGNTIAAPENGSVTFALFQQINGGDITEVRTITLDGTEDTAGETSAWTASFADLPKLDAEGYTINYMVQETAWPDGYIRCKEVTSSGYTEMTGEDYLTSTGGTIYNVLPTTTVTVKKLVEGNMADISKEFTFNYMIDNVAGTSFTLAHDGTKTISNVPIGSTLVITETGASDYTTTVTVTDSSSSTSNDGSFSDTDKSYTMTVPNGERTITFTNTKTAVAPTQLRSGIGPMTVLVMFSVAGFLLLTAHHLIDRARNSKL